MTRPMRPVLFGLLLVCATLAYGAQAPKYIFLFIGDGMGFNHVGSFADICGESRYRYR